MTYEEAARLLYSTWEASSGASPGALRILRACQTGSGQIGMEDLFRFDPTRRLAAIVVIETTLKIGPWKLNRALSADQVREIEEAGRDGQ